MKPSPRTNLELIFSCQKSENPCRKSKPAPQPIPRRRGHPHQLLSQNLQCHYASRERQLPSLQHLIRQRTCSSRTSHPFLNKHIGIARKGKIHVLEIFAGSARFSQCCALTGLKVGTPVDIRTGFDVMTSKGQHMVMEIIKEQAPDVMFMAPVCGPWPNMQNIQQDQQRVWEKRKRYLPMVEFVASIARYQLKHGRYFIIENPQILRYGILIVCSNYFQIHP